MWQLTAYYLRRYAEQSRDYVVGLPEFPLK
jgi:hypothetical protein